MRTCFRAPAHACCARRLVDEMTSTSLGLRPSRFDQTYPNLARQVVAAGARGAPAYRKKTRQAGRAARYRNIRKFSKKILITSIVSAVGTCTLITAFLSGSSSNATGTMLKFAAIGVISVPQ
jgi:hypothetical protein